MNRRSSFAWLIVAALCAVTAHAREASAPSASAVQGKPATGNAYPPVEYRFSDPQFLTQQVLWGIFHGVRLLGLACQAQGDHAAAVAYADWVEQQRSRIRAAEHELARYYYHRESATPESISTALGLKPALDVSPELLQAACNSLPEALAQQRYDLDKFYAERRAAAPKGTWKEPEEGAPTPQTATENTESQPKENP